VSELNEYVAAGLLDGFADEATRDPSTLTADFNEKYGLSVDEEVIVAAANILAHCNIAYTEQDPLAGVFVKISQKKYQKFIEAAVKKSDPEFKGYQEKNFSSIQSQIPKNSYIYVSKPNFDVYNKYKILRRYYQFGSPFIKKALKNLSSQGVEKGLLIDRSRIVTPSHNQKAYDQSILSLEELQKEVNTSNEVGDIFGDDRELVLDELSILSGLLKSGKVRVESTLAFAKKCLGWISEKAGSAAIGELSKRALSSIIEWLTS
jgi:hypothetical protein